MAWETLEFDFSNEVMGTAPLNIANTYDKVSIFFNFGTDGMTAGEKTYYWDDVEFGERISVVDIIVNSPDHQTLEDAVIAAQLADALDGAGPFTVFAPTDAAFENLPAGMLDDLLADPTGDLAAILQYHVLAGEVYSTDLTDGQMATTLQGEDITVTINGMNIMINQALVTTPDIVADNGVVHVIDAVIIPPTLDGVTVLDAASHQIKVSPNPASDMLQVDFAEPLTGATQLSIYNTNGQLLELISTRDQSTRVNTQALNAGMYFLRIDTGAASYYQKVMIVR